MNWPIRARAGIGDVARLGPIRDSLRGSLRACTAHGECNGYHAGHVCLIPAAAVASDEVQVRQMPAINRRSGSDGRRPVKNRPDGSRQTQ
jgi:hypothetical protein